MEGRSVWITCCPWRFHEVLRNLLKRELWLFAEVFWVVVLGLAKAETPNTTTASHVIPNFVDQLDRIISLCEPGIISGIEADF